MKNQISIFVLLVSFSVTGCFSKRLFQTKIPTNTEKPAVQVEGEKRAAEFIKLRSAAPVANIETAIAQIHDVATELSSSLGVPEKPVSIEDQAAIIGALRTGLAAKEKQLEAWKAFGRKYAGKEIEGTGFDLGPFLGFGGLIGVIALCVFVPGAGYVLLRVVPVLWGMVKRITTGIEAYAHSLPEEGDKLKHAFLSRTMNEVDKKIIKTKKKTIREATILGIAQNAPI